MNRLLSIGHLRPFEIVVLIYLALTSGMVLLFRHGLEDWYRFVLLRLGIGVLIYYISRFDFSENSVLSFVREWYFLPLFWILYGELRHFGTMIYPEYFDYTVVRWEMAIFGSVPATWLAGYFDSVVLTDLFMLGYFSYYLLIPLLAIPLFIRSDRTPFQHLVFGLSLTYLGCYLFYVFFPASGPSWFLPDVRVDDLQGLLFTDLVKFTHQGSVRAAAFPSLHVTGTVVVLLFAWQYQRGVFRIMIPLATLLSIGTVYGKFHFVVDALAGVLSGVLFFFLANRLWKMLPAQVRVEPMR